MPHWFIVTLVIFLVAPGILIILFGVYALFRSPEPVPPVSPAEAPADDESDTPSMSFSSSPVVPLTIETGEGVAPAIDDDVLLPPAEPIIDAEIEPAGLDPMLPAPPAAEDGKDVT